MFDVHMDVTDTERTLLTTGRAYIQVAAAIEGHVRRGADWRVVPNGEIGGVPVVAFVHRTRREHAIAEMDARLG